MLHWGIVGTDLVFEFFQHLQGTILGFFVLGFFIIEQLRYRLLEVCLFIGIQTFQCFLTFLNLVIFLLKFFFLKPTYHLGGLFSVIIIKFVLLSLSFSNHHGDDEEIDPMHQFFNDFHLSLAPVLLKNSAGNGVVFLANILIFVSYPLRFGFILVDVGNLTGHMFRHLGLLKELTTFINHLWIHLFIEVWEGILSQTGEVRHALSKITDRGILKKFRVRKVNPCRAAWIIEGAF